MAPRLGEGNLCQASLWGGATKSLGRVPGSNGAVGASQGRLLGGEEGS